jgi:hypothetical protein
VSDFNLKMCGVSEHDSAYQCARCSKGFCLECDRPTYSDSFKSCVRYCPDYRCQREKQLEEGMLITRKRVASPSYDAVVQEVLPLPRDQFVKVLAIEGTAREIATELREYVRDRFTPGSIASLDELERRAYELAVENLRDSHGHYCCASCFKEVIVERVRCSACATANPTPKDQDQPSQT